MATMDMPEPEMVEREREEEREEEEGETRERGPIPTVALLPPSPQRSAEQPQMLPVREPGAEGIQHLQMLLAMFKSRNMELLGEAGRLRRELENARQNIMILQNTSGDPEMVGGILDEMNRVALGAADPTTAAESMLMSLRPVEGGCARGGRAAGGLGSAAARKEMAARCTEFAMELEAMPKLPGGAAPDFATDPFFAAAAAVPAGHHHHHSSSSAVISPCIFNQ
jgi:hypothetical protein